MADLLKWFHFKIQQETNGSYLAIAVNETGHYVTTVNPAAAEEDLGDARGALTYVVAVICMYGFSIILMIASSVKRNEVDKGMSKYLNDLEKVVRVQKRQEKLKTRMAMHKVKWWYLPKTNTCQTLTTPLDNRFNWDEDALNTLSGSTWSLPGDLTPTSSTPMTSMSYGMHPGSCSAPSTPSEQYKAIHGHTSFSNADVVNIEVPSTSRQDPPPKKKRKAFSLERLNTLEELEEDEHYIS